MHADCLTHARRALSAFFMFAVIAWGASSMAETGPLPEDTGPTDIGTSDVGVSDAQGDIATDSASTDVDSMDASERDVSEDMGIDAEGDAGVQPPTGPATLTGRVDVKFAEDNSLVDVTLEPDGGAWSRTQTTGTSGEFAFSGIPIGSYDVTFERDDYVQIGQTLELRGDRVLNVALFPDQEAQLRAEAVFADDDSPPEEVAFSLTGARGTVSPDGPVSVDGGSAVWNQNDVPVGNWSLQATADGYLDASYTLGISPDAENSQYDVRLQMIPSDREADTVTTDDGGCGCRDEDARGGGGGRIPGGFGPGALLLVGWLALRRLTR